MAQQNKFMFLEHAIELVHGMAKTKPNPTEREQLALDVVEDFIVNKCEEPLSGDPNALRVRWEIDIFGTKDPRTAARQAWDSMRRPSTIATCFEVFDSAGTRHVVDLLENP